MKKVISYPISQKSPGWPGNPTYEVEQYTGIQKGDSANTFLVHIFNHFGTHLDAPNHFYDKGTAIKDLPLDNFLYKHPCLLDIPKKAGEKVFVEDLQPYKEKLNECDLLMIRTGFSKERKDDPRVYSENGPAISSDAARYLVENYAGKIKAVALDFISLASYSDSVDGDLAHQFMCGKYTPGHILIIEDVNLEGLSDDSLVYAEAIPLFMEGVDSSPVTMWVETKEA